MIRRFIKKLWSSVPKMSETVTAPHMKRKTEDESESTRKKVKTIKKEPVPQMQGNPNTKRKVAVLIAYNGKGYHGIQRNPPYPSIEEELLTALLKVGAITQDHYDKPGTIHFQRAARTDKNVSAASNIISLKMKNFLEVVNQELPKQIRIFGFKRTTKGFDCKTQCTGRTYMYVLPTYALAPEKMKITEEYRTTDEILAHANDVLKLYTGTHNFHNFTSGIKPTEQKAKRYIISFECGKPYIREGVEFVTCKVRGQSFMLHHIRKMIGLMIAIVKGCCKEDVLQLAWGPEKVDVPKAPGLGLLLDELYFDGYNKKWGRDGLHEPVEWSQYEEELEKFKEEYILPEIYKGEKNDKVMWDWLKTLHMHSFDVESNNRRHRNQDPDSLSSTNDADSLLKKEVTNTVKTEMSGEDQKIVVDENTEHCEEPNSQNPTEKDSDVDIKMEQDNDSEVDIKKEQDNDSEVDIKMEQDNDSEVDVKKEQENDSEVDIKKEQGVEPTEGDKIVLQ